MVDLLGVDACALLDDAKLQEFTGTSFTFDPVDGSQGGNLRSCFWSPMTIDPVWVQIDVFYTNGLADFFTPANSPGCTVVPVEGIGAEATSKKCAGGVALAAADRGVCVELQVRSPDGVRDPLALAATVAAVLDGI